MKTTIFYVMAIAVLFTSVGCEKQKNEKNPNPTVQDEIDNGIYDVSVGSFARKWSDIFYNCQEYGNNCFHPPIVVGGPKIELDNFRDAADLGASEVATYFNGTEYNEIFPFLDSTAHATKLQNLQSGDYDIITYVNGDVEYFLADSGTVTGTNFDFVLTVDED